MPLRPLLGLPKQALPHRRRADDRAAYRDYYDEEAKALVEQHFAADIKAFGSEFKLPSALIHAALLVCKRFNNIIWAMGDSTPSKVPRHLTQTDDQLDITSGRRSLWRIHHLKESGNASRPARFNIGILVTH